MHDWKDFLLWWALSMLGAATIVGGKLGLLLWGLAPDPPLDAVLAAHWRRRRRWLAYAELSALPAFATIAIGITAHRQFAPVSAVLIAMALGAIGFTLLLDGAQWIFRRRLRLLGGGSGGPDFGAAEPMPSPAPGPSPTDGAGHG